MSSNNHKPSQLLLAVCLLLLLNSSPLQVADFYTLTLHSQIVTFDVKAIIA